MAATCSGPSPVSATLSALLLLPSMRESTKPSSADSGNVRTSTPATSSGTRGLRVKAWSGYRVSRLIFLYQQLQQGLLGVKAILSFVPHARALAVDDLGRHLLTAV